MLENFVAFDTPCH